MEAATATPATQMIHTEVPVALRPDTVEVQTPTVVQAANQPSEPAAHPRLRNPNHRQRARQAAHHQPRMQVASGQSTAPAVSPTPLP